MSWPDFKTIAAIATPPGQGGIGVIRLSGPDSLPFTRRLLRNGGAVVFKPNFAALHPIVNWETNQVIDEAIVTWFQAPHSFTGEDVVEISGHGSPVVQAEILRQLRSFGAELAQAGEFSMRAFLNQRIDLTQAEAIRDLIHAQTRQQARIAARQLRGELSTQLRPVRDGLVELIVHFESTVEFVEDDLGPLNLTRFLARLDQFIETLGQLAATYRVGRLIRSGIRLAIIGRPNVGKSSLFNALLGFDRAIVTHLPGTTRDTVSEAVSIEGIPVTLVDTAGIRETDDVVEQIGVERTKTAITEADFILGVIESNSTLPPEERALFAQFPINLYAINKCDLGIGLTDATIESLAAPAPVVKVSALTGDGMEALRQAIYQSLAAGAQTNIEDAIITNERHFAALEETLTALRQAKSDLTAGFTEEVALANLHRALRGLGVITGETLIADIINQIFSTFCIGK
jgi:tRNA modification GTPase